MGFKEGFEKIAKLPDPVGYGLAQGLRGAGKVIGGSTGGMGMLGLASQGAQGISNYRKNKALMMGALQR